MLDLKQRRLATPTAQLRYTVQFYLSHGVLLHTITTIDITMQTILPIRSRSLQTVIRYSSSNICTRCQVSLFSTTISRSGPNSDRSKKRGVSALRRTGPRWPTAVSKEPLPRPVLNPAKRSKIKVNENHGLWAFFDKDRKAFEAPETVAEHGESSHG